jgi:hypothetical protein
VPIDSDRTEGHLEKKEWKQSRKQSRPVRFQDSALVLAAAAGVFKDRPTTVVIKIRQFQILFKFADFSIKSGRL